MGRENFFNRCYILYWHCALATLKPCEHHKHTATSTPATTTTIVHLLGLLWVTDLGPKSYYLIREVFAYLLLIAIHLLACISRTNKQEYSS